MQYIYGITADTSIGMILVILIGMSIGMLFRIKLSSYCKIFCNICEFFIPSFKAIVICSIMSLCRSSRFFGCLTTDYDSFADNVAFRNKFNGIGFQRATVIIECSHKLFCRFIYNRLLCSDKIICNLIIGNSSIDCRFRLIGNIRFKKCIKF